MDAPVKWHSLGFELNKMPRKRYSSLIVQESIRRLYVSNLPQRYVPHIPIGCLDVQGSNFAVCWDAQIGEDERAKSTKAKALAQKRQESRGNDHKHSNGRANGVDSTKDKVKKFSDQYLQTILNLAKGKGIDIQSDQFRVS